MRVRGMSKALCARCPPGSQSMVRLFLQHYLWRRQLGYLLSPTVQIDNFGKELRVADVACGTG